MGLRDDQEDLCWPTLAQIRRRGIDALSPLSLARPCRTLGRVDRTGYPCGIVTITGFMQGLTLAWRPTEDLCAAITLHRDAMNSRRAYPLPPSWANQSRGEQPTLVAKTRDRADAFA